MTQSEMGTWCQALGSTGCDCPPFSGGLGGGRGAAVGVSGACNAGKGHRGVCAVMGWPTQLCRSLLLDHARFVRCYAT